MVPFLRKQTPWKDEKQFVGVLAPKIKPPSRRRRQLLRDKPARESASFPSYEEFDGWLEPLGAEERVGDGRPQEPSPLLVSMSRALRADAM